MVAGLQPAETLLVHGGAGGIGTMAIQLATALGARVVATAGSADKLERCRELGADVAVNYRDEDFVAVAKAATDGAGVDVVLDIMGADATSPATSRCWRRAAAWSSSGCRAAPGPSSTSVPCSRKRGAVIATTLRSRPLEEKAAICAAVAEHVWPLVADGVVRPIVHTTMPLAEAGAAHQLMEDSGHVGKIVLTVAER